MSRTNRKILGLSAALAALGSPAVLTQSADAATANNQIPADEGTRAQAIQVAVGEELMSFTVGQDANGIVVADHESHASHASHSSHYSGM